MSDCRIEDRRAKEIGQFHTVSSEVRIRTGCRIAPRATDPRVGAKTDALYWQKHIKFTEASPPFLTNAMRSAGFARYLKEHSIAQMV
jgi:hypothetical protein